MFPSHAYVIRHAHEADAAVRRRLAGTPSRRIAAPKPSLRGRIRERLRIRRPVPALMPRQ